MERAPASTELRIVKETQGSHQLYFGCASHLNVPDIMTRDGVPYRIITDQLGSPRLVVNVNDGTVAQEMYFDEFGNIRMSLDPCGHHLLRDFGRGAAIGALTPVFTGEALTAGRAVDEASATALGISGSINGGSLGIAGAALDSRLP